jgi:hypothetical protein
VAESLRFTAEHFPRQVYHETLSVQEGLLPSIDRSLVVASTLFWAMCSLDMMTTILIFLGGLGTTGNTLML